MLIKILYLILWKFAVFYVNLRFGLIVSFTYSGDRQGLDN